MSVLDEIAGSAKSGTLYGIGVGPGDIRYVTLRAAGLVGAVDVIAYFAKRGLEGNARRIVDPLITRGRDELRLEYPVTDEVPVEDASYRERIVPLSACDDAKGPYFSMVLIPGLGRRL